MGIQTFPVAVPSAATGSTEDTYIVFVTDKADTYISDISLPAGVYEVTCLVSETATVSFFSGSTESAKVTTSSGTATANLASSANRVVVGGSQDGLAVSISKAGALPSSASAALDVITSSQTYTETGTAYVLLVGGGAGGQNEQLSNSITSVGGGSGGVNLIGPITLSGSASVTIGAGGLANSAGGATFFDSASVAGGAVGVGGSPGGGGSGVASDNPFFIRFGTTGGGGAGGNSPNRGVPGSPGAGDGVIGTGGTGGMSHEDAAAKLGQPGTGYGSGGGGSGKRQNYTVNGIGGAGANGLVAVLRVG